MVGVKRGSCYTTPRQSFRVWQEPTCLPAGRSTRAQRVERSEYEGENRLADGWRRLPGKPTPGEF
jgi:hypothetical protein